jgi:hypothetical protein
MQANLSSCDSEFLEAEDYWKLDKIYFDLAKFKGKPLSRREKQWLRGLLLGYTPQEIKKITCGSANSDALRPVLARTLYPWIKQLLNERTGQEIKVRGCRVLVLLEKLGYRKALMQ